jgi:hypothetical protein
MKKATLLSAILALCNWGPVQVMAATNPSERFLDAYFAIQDGDTAEAKGDWQTADARFTAALSVLQEIKIQNPDWNSRVIDFRTKYCNSHLEALKPKVASPQQHAKDVAPVQALVPAAPVEDSRVQQLTAELQESREKIRQIGQERDALRTRLEEELKKPAPTETAEAQKAQEHVRALEATRDALSAKLQEALAKAVQVETLKTDLQEAQERIRRLETSRAELEGTKRSLVNINQELAASRRDLETACSENLKLKEWGEKVLVKQIEADRQLRAAKSSSEKSNEIIVELRKENAQLRDVPQREAVVAVAGSDKGEPATTVVQESGSNKLVATINAPPALPPSAAAVVAQSADLPQPALAAQSRKADTLRVAPGQFGPAPAKITKLDGKYGFVVVDFSSRVMPPVGTRVTVYRDGGPVGEIQLTEPTRPQFATADILKGELQVGDEAR